MIVSILWLWMHFEDGFMNKCIYSIAIFGEFGTFTQILSLNIVEGGLFLIPLCIVKLYIEM
jgi:hypothetical protein